MIYRRSRKEVKNWIIGLTELLEKEPNTHQLVRLNSGDIVVVPLLDAQEADGLGVVILEEEETRLRAVS